MRSVWFCCWLTLCLPMTLWSAERSIPSPIYGQTTGFDVYRPTAAQLQAMAKRWGWHHVVWKVQNDYRWYGDVVCAIATLCP